MKSRRYLPVEKKDYRKEESERETVKEHYYSLSMGWGNVLKVKMNVVGVSAAN